MNKSLIYRSPMLYKVIMIALYGKEYYRRLHSLSEYIENNSSVIDLCCGFGDLYSQALKNKGIDYQGVDSSREFVDYGVSKGLDLKLEEVDSFSFPHADYYVMIDSLYHFFDNPKIIIKKMLSSARKKVLIMEPVKNLTDSKHVFISKLAKYMTNEGKNRNQHRFSEKSLDELLSNYFGSNLIESKLMEGSRDKLYILRNN